MAKTQSNILMAAREATEREIKRLEDNEKRVIKRPHFFEEPIAEIAGIDALYPENDLRKLIVIDLEEELKSFKEQNIDTMSYEKLAYWKKWASSVDRTLEAAADAVAAGQRLLHPRNLKHFLKIVEKEVDIQQFEAYIASVGRL